MTNKKKATPRQLRAAFRFYNRKYFNGFLPKKMRVMWSESIAKDYSGMCDYYPELSPKQRIPLNLEVRVSAELREHKWAWHFTLIHELTHAELHLKEALRTGKVRQPHHGPVFRARMRRRIKQLVDAGAFDKHL